jgi:hypothetical protein
MKQLSHEVSPRNVVSTDNPASNIPTVLSVFERIRKRAVENNTLAA